VSGRKLGAGRRRVDHTCGSRWCDLVLTLGPARPRGDGDTPPYAADAWAALPLAEQLAHAYGSLEEAEAAWWRHREELAAYDRDQLAQGEHPPEPAALQVFEPDTTWPPPAGKEQRHA
jgi:hypothetical protein